MEKFSSLENSFLVFFSFLVFYVICGSFTNVQAEIVKSGEDNVMVKSFSREMAFIKTFSSDMPVQYKQDQEKPARLLAPPVGLSGLNKPEQKPEVIGSDTISEPIREQIKADLPLNQTQEAQIKIFQEKTFKIQARPDETVSVFGNHDIPSGNPGDVMPQVTVE